MILSELVFWSIAALFIGAFLMGAAYIGWKSLTPSNNSTGNNNTADNNNLFKDVISDEDETDNSSNFTYNRSGPSEGTFSEGDSSPWSENVSSIKGGPIEINKKLLVKCMENLQKIHQEFKLAEEDPTIPYNKSDAIESLKNIMEYASKWVGAETGKPACDTAVDIANYPIDKIYKEIKVSQNAEDLYCETDRMLKILNPSPIAE